MTEKYIVEVHEYGTYWMDFETNKLHRLNGPAIEYKDGEKRWCQNGEFHRLDGPAVEWANGTKEWYQNGKLHRLNGPAIECADGSKAWYIEDECLTEEEFKRRTQPVKELTVAEIEAIIGYRIKIVKE